MKADEIRAAVKDISQETLADALAIALAEGGAPTQAVAGMDKPELANFAQAVAYLKKNYGFEELEYFSTEADLVYVNAGDRRVLLTDRMNAAFGNTLPASEENIPSPPPNDTPPESNGGRFSNLEI